MSAERDGCVFTLAQDELAALERWLTDVSAQGISVRAGLGRCVHDSGEVQQSLVDARIALADLTARGEGRWLMSFEDLDPIALVLTSRTNSRSHDRLAAQLAPLADEPRLLESLEAYFQSNLTVARAARLLDIHPNSLRYRLNRIEELLGQSLASPEVITLLYMALYDRKLHGTAIA